jgi:hypothetical protein
MEIGEFADVATWASAGMCGTASYSRRMQTVVKLFTGGKALLGQTSLFALFGVLERAWFNWSWASWQMSGDGVIPGEATIWGDMGPADANYTAWGQFTGAQTVNVTPRTGDPTLTLAELLLGDSAKSSAATVERGGVPTTAGTVIKLKSVTFLGDGYHDVLCDTNGQVYPGAHWETNTETHKVTSRPALYTSGSKMAAVAEFLMTPFQAATRLVVKGEGGGFVFLGTNDLAANTSTFSTPTTATAALVSNKVDFFNPLVLKWSYTRTNDGDFTSVGTSTNQVYVVWTPPGRRSCFIRLWMCRVATLWAKQPKAASWRGFGRILLADI